MTTLEALPIPDLGGLQVTVIGVAAIRLSGSIAMKDPRASLAPFLRALHDLACGLPSRRLEVDVAPLRFVSSSAIRVLLDWVTWLQQEPDGRRYELCFRADRSISWQRVSLPVLVEFAAGVVTMDCGSASAGSPA